MSGYFDTISRESKPNPNFGLLTFLGRLARRPKVLRRLARRRWFGNIYIGAAGKQFNNLMDLQSDAGVISWGDGSALHANIRRRIPWCACPMRSF